MLIDGTFSSSLCCFAGRTVLSQRDSVGSQMSGNVSDYEVSNSSLLRHQQLLKQHSYSRYDWFNQGQEDRTSGLDLSAPLFGALPARIDDMQSFLKRLNCIVRRQRRLTPKSLKVAIELHSTMVAADESTENSSVQLNINKSDINPITTKTARTSVVSKKDSKPQKPHLSSIKEMLIPKPSTNEEKLETNEEKIKRTHEKVRSPLPPRGRERQHARAVPKEYLLPASTVSKKEELSSRSSHKSSSPTVKEPPLSIYFDSSSVSLKGHSASTPSPTLKPSSPTYLTSFSSADSDTESYSTLRKEPSASAFRDGDETSSSSSLRKSFTAASALGKDLRSSVSASLGRSTSSLSRSISDYSGSARSALSRTTRQTSPLSSLWRNLPSISSDNKSDLVGSTSSLTRDLKSGSSMRRYNRSSSSSYRSEMSRIPSVDSGLSTPSYTRKYSSSSFQQRLSTRKEPSSPSSLRRDLSSSIRSDLSSTSLRSSSISYSLISYKKG